ncbi:MAG: alpha-amylase [Candidatus Woesearchaeota archaeon]|nr:MAG: alpha-amylase [Candidatus Woesearchaeota archaeon]
MNVCFYFQVHQPYRMARYRIFDIGHNSNYFDDHKNKEIIQKVAKKCYLPTNKLMLELINTYKNKDRQFKISYSITGTALEQFKKYSPETLHSFQKLAETGNVEFLSETYYHSLSFIYSKQEFKEQVKLHKELIKELFNQEPKVFRNTELIFNNELAYTVKEMGYKAVLAEGADHILHWRSPNYVYTAKTANNIRLLLKNYKLSDDIAFRFGQKTWKEYPLTADKFAHWVHNNKGHSVNLFMDYETFGEHQWEDTGIFDFMRHLPSELFKNPNTRFLTPSELAEYDPVAELDIHNFVSWADMERDLSAWKGNSMQESALNELYALEKFVKDVNDKKLLEDWRKLTTSDHFYYMCTKYFNDGDVHKYFSPYETPYESYINFMNIMNDIILRIKRIIHDRNIMYEIKQKNQLSENMLLKN